MNYLQWKASNPDYSIWVSASAGTGKTKILTDRVLRLLLEGAEPAKILCLTFTNAAANEMQSRISARLAKWANTTMDELRLDLQTMLGKKPIDGDLQCAKTLLNKSLKIEDKIEIHTIHSYCQKILKRFPLEAKVNPGFQILDDIKASEIISKVKNQIYLAPDCKELTKFFIANFHEVTINDIFNEIISQKLKFKKLQILTEPAFVKELSQLKEWDKSLNEIQSLFKGHQEILNQPLSSKEAILSFFLTKDGLRRQKIISKELALKNPDLLAKCEEYQEVIYKLDQLEKTEEIINYTQLLNKLATTFISQYEAYKAVQGLLDYDDLIFFTKRLLKSSEVRDWVLYKLDGGIDHLLVDEAQDTSPEQWEIIDAMIAEFYAGESIKSSKRTIFVVGDEKQSIFSFQGADLNSLNLMSHNLKNKLVAAKKNYEIISLKYSYRSTLSVLEVVYNIFERIKKLMPDLFQADNPKILPFREKHKGRVELWPLIKPSKAAELFWPKSSDHDSTLSSSKQLAIKIAQYIKKEMDKGEVLPSTGLPVKVQDFMILVRKRDNFTLEIINQLKNHSLQTAGIDRMLLSENLSVMDLITIAKFTLNPLDDLNLAGVLKSPIIGLCESAIQKLIQAKEGLCIWEILQRLNGSEYAPLEYFVLKSLGCDKALKKLEFFLQLYNQFDTSNFFHVIADSLGYRELLIKANGYDSNDAINELLYLSFNYTHNVERSLQSFIYWFETNEVEIKRNIESADKVKLMTVHSSKGLQAPIIILCDTTSVPMSQSKFFWTKDGDLIASHQSSRSPEFFKDIKEEQQQKELQEYIRLLYVGMTRAQDNLIVCGYQAKDKMLSHCWYQLITNSMQDLAQTNQDGVMIYENFCGEKRLVNNALSDNSKTSNEDLPHTFIDETVQNTIFGEQNLEMLQGYFESTLLDNITASTIPSTTLATFSPLINSDFLEYGKIFHKILEDVIKMKNFKNMHSHPLIKTLAPAQQDKMYSSINNLFEKAEFETSIKGEVKSEVNIGFLQDGVIKLGRIDFLSIENNQLTIIDYKSDAKPPHTLELIPKAYIDQLGFYKLAVQKLYPDHKIICKILWLQNGEFMDLHFEP